MSFEDLLMDLKTREDRARAMGGPERLARREARGVLNARSRIDALIDRVVDSDEEALEEIKRFLGYMPSNCNEPPPQAPVPAGSDEGPDRILDILPESRKRTYDVAAWPTAEVSFMDPRYATEVVTWGRRAEEQDKQRIREQMEKDSSAYGLAEIYGVQAVISPADTRRYLIRQLEIHQLRLSGGIGRHRMSSWPTTY